MRLFAINKDEKERIVKLLKDCKIGLSHSNEQMPADQFLLPKFIDFCNQLSLKQEIQPIFEDLYVFRLTYIFTIV